MNKKSNNWDFVDAINIDKKTSDSDVDINISKKTNVIYDDIKINNSTND